MVQESRDLQALTTEGLGEFGRRALRDELERLLHVFAPRIASATFIAPQLRGLGSGREPTTVQSWRSIQVVSSDERATIATALVGVLDGHASLGMPVSVDLINGPARLEWSLAVPDTCAKQALALVASALPTSTVTLHQDDRLSSALSEPVVWVVDLLRPGLDALSLLSDPAGAPRDDGVLARLLSRGGGCAGVQVVLVPLLDAWNAWLERLLDVRFLLACEGDGLVVPSQWQGGVQQRVRERVGGGARRLWAVVVRAFGTRADADVVGGVGLALQRLVVGGRACAVADRDAWAAAGIDATDLIRRRASTHVGCVLHSGEVCALMPLPVDLPVGRDDVSGLRIGVDAVSGAEAVLALADVCAGGVHVVGSTRCGKTTLLEHLAVEAFSSCGAGGVVLDVHGDFARRVASLLCARGARVWGFDATRADVPPLSFLNVERGSQPGWWVDGLVGAFRGVFGDSWGQRLEHVLRSTFLSLALVPNTCVADALVLLGRGGRSDAWRRTLVSKLPQAVARFWREDFPKYRGGELDSTVNKLARLVSVEGVRRWFESRRARWEWRARFDAGEWAVFRLPVGVLGGGVSVMVASLVALVAGQVCMGRPEGGRRSVLVVMDEAHRLSGEVVGLVCEGAKFGVVPVFAHQALSQLSREVAQELGVCGVTACFRPAAADVRWAESAMLGRVRGAQLSSLDVGVCGVRSGRSARVVRVSSPVVVEDCWEVVCAQTAAAWGCDDAGVGVDVDSAPKRRVYDDL